MRYTIPFLALALAASAFVVEEKKCLGVGVVCKDKQGVTGLCCSNAYCPDPMVDVSKCTLKATEIDLQAKCLKAGATCQSIAGPTGECCSGTRCVIEGPDRGVCRGPKKAEVDDQAKCLKAGATCQSIAGPTGKCCSGLNCVIEGPDRGVCRGPKKLEVLVRTEVVVEQDVDSDVEGDSLEIEAKCGKTGKVCNNLSPKPGKCCKGFVCKMVSTDHGVCQKAPKCLLVGESCAGLRGPIGTCCKGSSCVYTSPDNGHCVPTKGGQESSLEDFDSPLLVDQASASSSALFIEKENEEEEEGLELTKPKKCLKVGAMCDSIAGPTGTCCKGTECVNIEPDLGRCQRVPKSSCSKEGKQCMSENGRFIACCPELECVRSDPKKPYDGWCSKKAAADEAEFEFEL